MPDIHQAEIVISVCEQRHVHLTMRSVCDCGVDCPDLGLSMDAEDAREFAVNILKAANEISPVS